MSLYQVFREVALKHPNNIAFISNGNKISYKALLKKIDEASSYFSMLDIRKKDYISISLFNRL